MNPSASGWIKKLLKICGNTSSLFKLSDDALYKNLRSSGFIYGSNLYVIEHIIEKGDLTEEEICKINLCLALLYTHKKANIENDFVESVIDFYNSINETKTSFFRILLSEKKTTEQLEKIFHKRIQIDTNILTKNFKYFIVNALLFIDVLAYKRYLENKTISTDYLTKIEASIASISLNVLNSKAEKNQYDESLIRLFESSLRYFNEETNDYKHAISHINTSLEKQYMIDLACMATWTDKVIDIQEQKFLISLRKDLNLEKDILKESIITINSFYTQNKNNIALLSSKNLVKSFYDNSSKMVTKLISRNRKRLYQELLDSKELMVLLTQSTIRDLTKEEQKKVQEQLLDIFKSIPSLAIFLLPGGAILLPLVVKFIPKLLPSAFDENRIEDE
ncbi:LETM1-related biofilm-associated protein [Neotamlana laminarinivorans]|uniref:LETM1 domain-containing protein n=1 Tax=Neotamlana laminarinivorans TaxID=2883124 RepID=A0A9X1HYY4_9FLAO|nr:LETM1-related biofilm-associated protein [Tamlana laminarinivorans]MCB4798679.1 LETM1 domain-containing protein [Tamlana laminarinivorans]